MQTDITTIENLEAAEALESESKTSFGFWVYIMTDCVLFATLFATYAVLHNNTIGGPGPKQLFSLPFVFGETIILLISSYTCALAELSAKRGQKSAVISWLGVTFLLGISFFSMELSEFSRLIRDGNGFQRNAFLSSFFTLVGTHGLHILLGSVWLLVLIIQIYLRGLNRKTAQRLGLFGIFWHFLDVIWIFIFTIVYLLGVI